MRVSISLLGLATAVMLTVPALAGDKDTVKYRKNNMHIIGGHMGSISAIIKGEVPHSAELKAHADGLAAMAPLVKNAFKENAMAGKTDALPKIWKEWDDFAKAADEMETAAKAFAAAVASNDKSAIGAKLGALGDTCKGCHDKYTEEH